jgi:hypothetical protein
LNGAPKHDTPENIKRINDRNLDSHLRIKVIAL